MATDDATMDCRACPADQNDSRVDLSDHRQFQTAGGVYIETCQTVQSLKTSSGLVLSLKTRFCS